MCVKWNRSECVCDGFLSYWMVNSKARPHHTQPPFPSPPTEGEDWEEDEGDWDEEEEEELDEDAYAALEGLLLGEAGGT